MIDAMGKVRPGNMQDALNINNLQKEGFDTTGIAPFSPDNIQHSTVRDDGKPVKAVTCVISTVKVPHTTRTLTMDRTWCKDEVGAEYVGFNGWPLKSTVAKACHVGDADCPIYLSLQGDDPTRRDDSVQFTPLHPVKVPVIKTVGVKKADPEIVAHLKANGCDIINQYKKSPPKCGSVLSVTGGGVRADSPETPYEIDYTEADTGSRVQWPVKLTYRDKTLVKFTDRDDVIDLANPENNKPDVTEAQSGGWNITRNASTIEFSTTNAAGTQIVMTCQNGDFTVAYGQDGSLTSSDNPMNQLAFQVGQKDYSAGEELFNALKASSNTSFKVLMMGSASDATTFTTAGLNGLMKDISWDNCRYPSLR
ncbi:MULTISPECIES: hypothetical protein [Pseudescherichia]|uniref:hypothetical protein n=1 Tax=Pseudescherichia TaxID=2055880 RepID=UPI001EDFD221|nr:MULTISPECIES: hypothetical protein [Pseudescherichia]